MDSEMRNRLRMIAKGQVSHDNRVTRVADPLPALEPEAAPAETTNVGQPAVTRVTRKHPVFLASGNTDGCSAPRVTDLIEGDWLNPDNVDELNERAAIAQSEAGFPAEFALAFAQIQVNVPPGVDEEHWHRVVDAMGRVLDQCRERVGGTREI